MTDSIEVTGLVPAEPAVLFSAFLNGETHSAMTGGKATIEGDAFTAWDGYIWGRTLETEPPRRIVQEWRTSEFPDDAGPSRLEILLERVADGTRVTFRHSAIPEGQGVKYEQGWVDHYLDPMNEHFG